MMSVLNYATHEINATFVCYSFNLNNLRLVRYL